MCCFLNSDFAQGNRDYDLVKAHECSQNMSRITRLNYNHISHSSAEKHGSYVSRQKKYNDKSQNDKTHLKGRDRGNKERALNYSSP